MILFVMDLGIRKVGQRSLQLIQHSIVVEEGRLIQTGADGEVIGCIDLSRRYLVRYATNAGNSVYKVRQRNGSTRNVIEFTTDIEDCERLVSDVLKCEWPPGSW